MPTIAGAVTTNACATVDVEESAAKTVIVRDAIVVIVVVDVDVAGCSRPHRRAIILRSFLAFGIHAAPLFDGHVCV